MWKGHAFDVACLIGVVRTFCLHSGVATFKRVVFELKTWNFIVNVSVELEKRNAVKILNENMKLLPPTLEIILGLVQGGETVSI